MNEPEFSEDELLRQLQTLGGRARRSEGQFDIGLGFPNPDAVCSEYVARLHQVTAFSVSFVALSDRGLEHIAGLPHLDALYISHTLVTGKGLAVLSTLPRLRRLNCNRLNGHLQEGIENIAEAKSLEVLELFSDLNMCDASPLGRLKRLRRIAMGSTGIKQGLAALGSCPSLSEVNLGRTRADDETLEGLAKLPLRKLHVDETDVTDVGVRELEGCQTLETLSLSASRVTSACLDSVRKLRNLSTLFFQDLLIDEVAFNTLCHMGQLRNLWLSDPSCPPERRRELQSHLKQCDIVWMDDVAELESEEE